MFFLNFVIAFLFVVLFLSKIGFIDKMTSTNIFNRLYSMYSLNFTKNTQLVTQSLVNYKTEQLETEQSEAEQPNTKQPETKEIKESETEQSNNVVKYKYNPVKHLSQFISKISNISNEKIQTEFEYVEDDIKKINEEINKIDNPTIKDFNKILSNQSYKYSKYIKEFLQLLNYEIPIITHEQKKAIIIHFLNNKIKFSRYKTGHAPYCSFFDICVDTIKELNLPINLKLQKLNDNINNDEYLQQKKNN